MAGQIFITFINSFQGKVKFTVINPEEIDSEHIIYSIDYDDTNLYLIVVPKAIEYGGNIISQLSNF